MVLLSRRFLQRLPRVVSYLPSLLAFGAMLSCSSFDDEAPVVAAHRFEADGRTCSDCDEPAFVVAMREAIAAREGLDIVRWYGQHLVRTPGAAILYIAPEGEPLPPPGEPVPTPEPDWDTVFDRLHYQEFRLDTASGLLHYERKPLWYWVHVSHSYLTRFDMKGQRLWRRHVPYLSLPVWPVTTERFVLYLNDGGERTSLVFVSLRSGRAGLYPLPVELNHAALWHASELPYVWDRFVVFPPSAEDGEEDRNALEARGFLVVELAEGS